MNNAHILESYRPVNNRALAAVEIGMTALVIALAAHVRIPLPWTEVPVTLQTLPVLAMPFIVGTQRSAWGILLYLFLGGLQMPVFAVTTGATFGFLASWAVVPLILARFKPAMGILISTLFIYAVGTAWYCVFKGIMPWTALMMTVVPFIPGDVAKGVAAWLVGRKSPRA